MDTQDILQALHQRGLSDPEIAKAVDVAQSTIWRIRTGRNTDTRRSTAAKILDYFKTTQRKSKRSAGGQA